MACSLNENKCPKLCDKINICAKLATATCFFPIETTPFVCAETVSLTSVSVNRSIVSYIITIENCATQDFKITNATLDLHRHFLMIDSLGQESLIEVLNMDPNDNLVFCYEPVVPFARILLFNTDCGSKNDDYGGGFADSSTQLFSKTFFVPPGKCCIQLIVAIDEPILNTLQIPSQLIVDRSSLCIQGMYSGINSGCCRLQKNIVLPGDCALRLDRHTIPPIIQECICEATLTCFNNFNYAHLLTDPISYHGTYPGPPMAGKSPNINTYFNIFVDTPLSSTLRTLANPNGIYGSYCLDFHDPFRTVSDEAYLLSVFDPNAASELVARYSECNHGPGTTLFTTYLESIVYVMNESLRYLTVGYTVEDIQSAIWTLLFSTDPVNTMSFFNSPAHPAGVRMMMDEAISAQNHYNLTNDACRYLMTNKIAGLMVFPRNPNAVSNMCGQILILAVAMCELPDLC